MTDQTRNPGRGFIIIESLVALAMVSILAIGSLTLIQTVSIVYESPSAGEIGTIISKLNSNPKVHTTDGRLRLKSTRSLTGGGTWRVYMYRSQSGEPVKIPVYLPSKD